MAKSFSYFIVLLKDQSRGLARLVQLSLDEQKVIRGENWDTLSALIDKKKELIRKLKLWESEKAILWKDLQGSFEKPANQIEKIQAAECRACFLKHRTFARRLAKINKDNANFLKNWGAKEHSFQMKLVSEENRRNNEIQEMFSNHL